MLSECGVGGWVVVERRADQGSSPPVDSQCICRQMDRQTNRQTDCHSIHSNSPSPNSHPHPTYIHANTHYPLPTAHHYSRVHPILSYPSPS